jgi:thiosulfate dehydrogenase [quinone] large subunit
VGLTVFAGAGDRWQEEQRLRRDFLERVLVLFFRVAMGWIFLHAGLGQVLTPHFSVVPFLSHTTTFHDVFAIFTSPGIALLVGFLVSWGQVLIGFSLLFGALVSLSAPFGILLMLLFWLAHMDWPFDDGRFYVFVGPDLLFAGIILLLLIKRAGHVVGLDAILLRRRVFARRESFFL